MRLFSPFHGKLYLFLTDLKQWFSALMLCPSAQFLRTPAMTVFYYYCITAVSPPLQIIM